MWAVRYKGFLQEVVRRFETKERALQWTRQVGREREASITFEATTE